MNNKYVNRLKEKFEEDPLTTIAVVSLAVTATAKLVEVISADKSRRAYARQINNK